MKLLSSVAKKSGDPRLSALVVTSRIAAFGKAKKTIQDMVDNFVVEKEDVIKHKDFYIEELSQNERDNKSKNRVKADLKATVTPAQRVTQPLIGMAEKGEA